MGQSVNTFIITARACTRALAEHKVMEAAGGRAMLALGPGHQRIGGSDTAALTGGSVSGRHFTTWAMMIRLLPVRLANAVEAVRVEARIAMLEALAAWGQQKRMAKSMV